MALTPGSYTQAQILTDAETGATAPQFMDTDITAATLASGVLKQRLDPVAFPQKGITYSGTDADGNAVPAPAKAVTG